MNQPPASLSEEALSKLIYESHATITKTESSTGEVMDRVQVFAHAYRDLANKPDGVALLFREPAATVTRSQSIGRNLVVGRLPKSEHNPAGCDLAFEDDRMSRRHFEISLVDGLYLLRDLESRNGTYVNSGTNRIRETVLKAGDLILAGHLVFVFTGE